jgi:hypothetical protein
MMPEAFHYLTAEYRARLRPTVNPEALERFLAAIEPAARTAAVLLRQELAETQERLDFTERLLSKSREERRIGS